MAPKDLPFLEKKLTLFKISSLKEIHNKENSYRVTIERKLAREEVRQQRPTKLLALQLEGGIA